jgi:hypothetical protein
MWYQREEMQFRQALFFSAASVAGAFSGLLAYAIDNMDGVAGVAGWRWIFILEGIATVVVAAGSFFLLYDFPETAAFLSEEERAFVVHRLKYQGQVGEGRVAQAEEFRWRYVRDAFLDWQVWVNIWVYWGVSPVWVRVDVLTFVDCVSALRDQSVSADDYQESALHLQQSPADDGPDLHRGRHRISYHGIRIRSRRTEEPLHSGIPPDDGRGLRHVRSASGRCTQG